MVGVPRGLRRSRPMSILVAAAALLTILAGACSSGSTQPGPLPRRSLLPSSPTALPEFDPARFQELLSQLRGKPVVVNIWASWCGPCIVEAPGLARAARDYQGRVQFLGVDVLDQRAAAQAFIRKYGWTYPSVFDPTGAIRNDLGFVGQPVTVVFDSSGKRVFTGSGAVSESQLRKELNKVA
jgi:thiol-disulfide isomerase/thioredoxin